MNAERAERIAGEIERLLFRAGYLFYGERGPVTWPADSPHALIVTVLQAEEPDAKEVTADGLSGRVTPRRGASESATIADSRREGEATTDGPNKQEPDARPWPTRERVYDLICRWAENCVEEWTALAPDYPQSVLTDAILALAGQPAAQEPGR